MDKRNINIDDLVRQRLGGVEENERDGAWMRMSELLDQEPKRKRPGIFFWRNTLGAVSGLVLLGLAGMGAYKISSSYSARHAQGEQLVASAMDGKATAALTIPAIRREVVNNHAAPGNSKTSVGLHTPSVDRKVAGTTNGHQYASAHEDMHVAVSNDLQATDVNEPKTIFLRNSNNASTNTAINNNKKVAVVATSTGKQATHAVAMTKGDQNKTPLVTTSTNVTSDNNSSSHGSDKAQTLASVDQKHTGSEGRKAGTAAAAPNGESAPAGKLIVAAHAPANNGISKTADAESTAKAAKTTTKETVVHSNGEGESLTAKVIAEAIAASKRTPDTKAEQANNTITGTNILNGSAPASSTTAVKSTGSTTGNKVAYNQKTTGKKSTEHRTKELPLASAGKAGKEENAASKPVVQEPTAKTVVVTRESKVINKLLLRETYIKTAPNEGYFRLDTISMEELFVKQRTAESTENITVAAAAVSKKKNVATTGNEEANAGAEVAADPKILAAAKEESASQQGTVVKEKVVVKNTMSTAEKLSLAFNDIKSNIRGTQFAPGLTGGINGTFFGPSGIKGFQFGVTGELIFTDNVSIKGELKYFNRMNSNDFELKDDYYTYTANGGQYVKTQQMHSVSFATIHSLELPISVRYTSGKFSFFAGGNTVYSFSVNASESTLQAPTSSTVAVKGNDNNPTVTEGDFGSRFGLGYLFGMSYQAAPNFIIDLRNVQTVWDNASSQGAKSVSSQLYKHPSLQLSVGYRLSGKKSED